MREQRRPKRSPFPVNLLHCFDESYLRLRACLNYSERDAGGLSKCEEVSPSLRQIQTLLEHFVMTVK
jgi:hypothetical protein